MQEEEEEDVGNKRKKWIINERGKYEGREKKQNTHIILFYAHYTNSTNMIIKMKSQTVIFRVLVLFLSD